MSPEPTVIDFTGGPLGQVHVDLRQLPPAPRATVRLVSVGVGCDGVSTFVPNATASPAASSTAATTPATMAHVLPLPHDHPRRRRSAPPPPPAAAAAPPPCGSASKISPGPAFVPTGAPANAGDTAVAEIAPPAATAVTPESVSSPTPGAWNPAIGAERSRCGNTSGSGAGVGNAAANAPRRAASPAASRRAVDVRRGRPRQHVVERPQQRVVRQGLADPGRQRPHRRVGDEGHRPRHRLVQDEGQGVDVGLPVDGLALRRLGRDVARRPHHRPRRLGPRRLRQRPGHAEVGNPDPPLLVEQEVRRLDVAVHQPADVRVRQSLRHLRAQLRRLRVRQLHAAVHAGRAATRRPDTPAPGTARRCPRPSRTPATRAGGSATPPSAPRPGSA